MRKNWIRAGLFAGAGALAGYIYYYFFGCTSGCAITSNPFRVMIYTALIGLLLNYITKKESGEKCNM